MTSHYHRVNNVSHSGSGINGLRSVNATMLPPRAGYNWNDPAFGAQHGIEQRLENELRGTSYFAHAAKFHNPLPDHLGSSAKQLLSALSMRGQVVGAPYQETSSNARLAALPGKVLRFYAIFKEPSLDGEGSASSDFRQMKIHFFLEDDTVLIQEENVENSGRDGGVFLKRQRVRTYGPVTNNTTQSPPSRNNQVNTADARDSEFLSMYDFKVNRVVPIYGINFFIYDCDAFTREFLTEMGAQPESSMDASMAAVAYETKLHSTPSGCAIRPEQYAVHTACGGLTECDRDASNATNRWQILPHNSSSEPCIDDCTAEFFASDSDAVLRFYGLLLCSNQTARATQVPWRKDHGCGGDSNCADMNNKRAGVACSHEPLWGAGMVSTHPQLRTFEVRLFVSDQTIVITAVHDRTSGEPGGRRLFLRRGWLPKSGSVAALSELTFAHCANGPRRRCSSPADHYRDVDLRVGATINALGRFLLLYDCDEYTRQFYQTRYAVTLAPAMDEVVQYIRECGAMTKRSLGKPRSSNAREALDGKTKNHSNDAGQMSSDNMTVDTTNNTTSMTHTDTGKSQLYGSHAARVSSSTSPSSFISIADDVLRFLLVPTDEKHRRERQSRFTLALYTATGEVSVYERANVPNSGHCDGYFVKRQRLRKPSNTAPLRTTRANAHAQSPSSLCVPMTLNEQEGNGRRSSCVDVVDSEYYTLDDFRVGGQIVVNGIRMNITQADAHTDAYFAGRVSVAPTHDQVHLMLRELRECLNSRYTSLAQVFLVFDDNHDGVVELHEFGRALRALQITTDVALTREMFHCVTAHRDVAFLTFLDLARWLSGPESLQLSRSLDTQTPPMSAAVPVFPTLSSHTQNYNGSSSSSSSSRSSSKKRSCDTGKSSTLENEARLVVYTRSMRRRVLRELCTRLEERCMKSADMFRLSSTMPRAYAGCRSDVYACSNPRRDVCVTPVQLRRCLCEVLGAHFTEDEVNSVLGFFFPCMPSSAYPRQRDDIMDYFVDLKEFQRKYHIMWSLFLLDAEDV